MSRKKIAISPSLIQCSKLRHPTSFCYKRIYGSPIEEFVIKSESAVQIMSRIPLDFSESKYLLNMSDNRCLTMSIVVTSQAAKKTMFDLFTIE